MSDIAISNDGVQWDLTLTDGDLDLIDDNTELARAVGQRVVYTLMTWLGESVYDPTVGIPYLDGVFGVEPVEGVAGVLLAAIQDTDGVSEVTEFDFELESDRQLALTIGLVAAGEPVSFTLQVAV